MPSPKLIYLVTEDWYFWSHRLPMARAAQNAGFHVGVATRVTRHAERIAAEGFVVHPLPWRRRSLNPLDTLRAIIDIVRLYRRERPDIVHHVALKPVALGAVAAWLAGVPVVISAFTGLGFLFISQSWKAQILRPPVVWMLGRLLNRKCGVVIAQNEDDRQTLIALGLTHSERAVLIRGSGIDATFYQPQPEPTQTSAVIAAYVGRMLDDKGVRVLVDAHQRAYLKAQTMGVELHLWLVGPSDSENPTAISEKTLRTWSTLPGVSWLGPQESIREIWAQAHIAILASRREGLPKSLLEAAACGRPLIATDVPGCREIARAGENALLVPPDDVEMLSQALTTLAVDSDLRRRFGKASRALIESDLSAEKVGENTVALYQRCLNDER
ncbi:Glycosyltransferase involved in cell wall biosynthesis [Azospirillaceae bacterium]